jgi:hypothetical protein
MSETLLEELIAAIEKETSSYEPIVYPVGDSPESLKRADGSDMSEQAARAVLAIVWRVQRGAWSDGHRQAIANIAWPTERKSNPYGEEAADD